MISISVDTNTCSNYGQCCFEAEDIFSLDDKGVLQFIPQADDSRLEELENAADACPMQAISLTQS
ncbi:MAG: ferredoxin [Candidatus Nanopelagicales bacterium]|nr:ferredoxin [Candidatus Nanopelagicales bacterium]MCF8538410.1 ferredoxin [Candidatus Nanopelagicales bacterium]MCF8542884.1 ferredoxin [Candidatus Nanopelagicales bacterium]MCF8558142.1 ferredoxin [Candidatus Nanopelagicales bacterium]